MPTWARSRAAAGAGRAALWFGCAWILTGIGWGDLATRTPGDAGDGLFVLSTLQWGADRLPHLFHGYWAGPYFVGASNPMAYSDTLLGMVPPFWLLRTITGSDALALNLLVLGALALAAELTFRLVRRVTASAEAGAICAVCFVGSSILLGQIFHPQLILGSPFVPMVALLTVRFLDAPSPKRGAALGAAVATTVITTTYYGLFVVIAAGVTAVAWLVLHRRTWSRDRFLALAKGAAVGAAVAGVVVAPVAVHYLSLSRDPYFDRGYTSMWALRPSDLRAVTPFDRLLGGSSVLDPGPRSSESYAFAGFVTLLGAAIGAVVLAVGAIRRDRSPMRRRELVSVGLAGVAAMAIAAGRYSFAGLTLPFRDVTAAVVPGFEGVRALVRFEVVGQLGLVVLAGAGFAWSLGRIRAPQARAAVAALLVVAALAELRVSPPRVEVPTRSSGGEVYRLLDDEPSGRVLELPMAGTDGSLWPFTEAPRMVLGIDGRHPRLNGYSGWAPPEYEGWVDAAAALPDPAALRTLLDAGVRYLVIHTEPVDPGVPGVADRIVAAGDGSMSKGDAAALIDGLPAGCAADVQRAVDGVVVVLDVEACGAAR